MKPTVNRALFQLEKSGRMQMWEGAKEIVRAEDLDVIPALLRIASGRAKPERRAAAVWALGFLRVSDALDTLMTILDRKAEANVLREHAAEALGYLADPRARAALVRNLSDPSADIVFSCVFALRTVGKAADIPTLKYLTKNSTLKTSSGESIRKEAGAAIRQILWRSSEKR
jgi:HEAT repeat protein